jgi:hypothetical protein
MAHAEPTRARAIRRRVRRYRQEQEPARLCRRLHPGFARFDSAHPRFVTLLKATFIAPGNALGSCCRVQCRGLRSRNRVSFSFFAVGMVCDDRGGSAGWPAFSWGSRAAYELGVRGKRQRFDGHIQRDRSQQPYLCRRGHRAGDQPQRDQPICDGSKHGNVRQWQRVGLGQDTRRRLAPQSGHLSQHGVHGRDAPLSAGVWLRPHRDGTRDRRQDGRGQAKWCQPADAIPTTRACSTDRLSVSAPYSQGNPIGR